MNKKQRISLALSAMLIALMLLFPPFHFYAQNGAVINMGYAFLFDPPHVSGQAFATVDMAMLLMQWAAVLLVTGILWLLGKD